ncbi:glycine-rich cell wall structural protein, putative [Trichomonas vaginalis G3]|uniref:receptor protein-tyrosine kinase n=1 Tax=Trichomonas vaginalis (strain ATCC PRA-98 / G3) TaxID=412133 RepID=A2FBR4_TRIV3|nr:glycine-rich protein family [Trichomonas vaginalis G3]EAX97661.1 glycine-rich cell wall structural protein, putative [Trichomonas vaginalis G3]KAI5510378.1 glycine-rich protein family [Trichomonas vaginalis G3]|eukprot:XP_001310591.1 glycine-rich cell wall structural protein [Trichomonas vaginalis G3]
MFAFRNSTQKRRIFLEVWGAQGGKSTAYSYCTANGGFGGYSSGVNKVFNDKTIYLHLGGTIQLSEDDQKTIYNGGGYRENIRDAPGGGASDFRTSPGNWNVSFESRIIIAGGGGGSGCYLEHNPAGGNGGGINGTTDSTKTACYGTQTGNDGISGRRGSLGKGYGGYFGSGGGRSMEEVQAINMVAVVVDLDRLIK